MLVKTYEDEYRDCQDAYLKLVNENTKLKAEVERKKQYMKTILEHIDTYRHIDIGDLKRFLNVALKDDER